MHAAPNQWPSLPYPEWAETKKTVQLYSQMLGKTRLALSPTLPEWLGSSLEVTARGLTTGAMAWGTASVEVSLDFIEHKMRVETSSGRSATLSLLPAMSVAHVYGTLCDIYAEFGIDVDIWDKPQELDDTTPFSADMVHATYDADAIRRWWTAISAIRNVFDEWRSPFFGRSSVQFWWGAFDIAVLLFNGEHAVAPNDRGYIVRYDLDAEFMNAGFWPGDDSAPNPVFYAYIHPRPEGCELVPINAQGAAWVEQMDEWMVPYEAVLATGDPRQALLSFLDCVYAIAGSHAGWDLKRYTYTPPTPPKHD